VTRPFRFAGGLFRAQSAAACADGARQLESAGYDTVLISDHFSPVFFAPIPAMMAAALATSRLRVGCTVFANDFRHPATLAKEVATADVLSGGRFEFGFGAGYQKSEYDRVGIRFGPPAVRVSRFEEALHVIKGLWADGSLTFAGRHYTITDYDSQPKPLRRPHPPIFIGGGRRQHQSSDAAVDFYFDLVEGRRTELDATNSRAHWSRARCGHSAELCRPRCPETLR